MRKLGTFFTILLLATFACLHVAPAAEPQIHKGTVVSASNGQLVLKDASGKEQTHLVSRETKVTINGRVGRLEELKMSTRVRVTTEGSDKVVSVATVDDDKYLLTAN
jgi:hypothetical protein